MQIRSLGYVRFDVTDVDAWVAFAEILGLSVAAHDGGRSAALRVDEWACRISLEHADSDRLHAAGWELRDLVTLEAAAAELDSAGVTFKELAEPEVAARGIEAGIAFDDPSGNRLELFCSPRVSTHPPVLADVSSFLTGEQGLGHVVLPAAEMEQTFRFYTQVLGFRHRDSMLVQPHQGAPYRMRFLGCNPRHHSVALTEATTPRGIRHLMVNAAHGDRRGQGVRPVPVSGRGAPHDHRAALERPDDLVLRGITRGNRDRVRGPRAGRRRQDLEHA